jgi:hypothetical protein
MSKKMTKKKKPKWTGGQQQRKQQENKAKETQHFFQSIVREYTIRKKGKHDESVEAKMPFKRE